MGDLKWLQNINGITLIRDQYFTQHHRDAETTYVQGTWDAKDDLSNPALIHGQCLHSSTQEGRKLTEIEYRNLAAGYITKPDISISNIEKCQPTEKPKVQRMSGSATLQHNTDSGSVFTTQRVIAGRDYR